MAARRCLRLKRWASGVRTPPRGVTVNVPIPRALWRRARVACVVEDRQWRDFVLDALRTYLRTARKRPRPKGKLCQRCKGRFPRSAFGRNGLDAYCAPCRREYGREWRRAHAGVMNARQRERYAANRETARGYFREYHRRREALIRAGDWRPRKAGA